MNFVEALKKLDFTGHIYPPYIYREKWICQTFNIKYKPVKKVLEYRIKLSTDGVSLLKSRWSYGEYIEEVDINLYAPDYMADDWLVAHDDAELVSHDEPIGDKKANETLKPYSLSDSMRIDIVEKRLQDIEAAIGKLDGEYQITCKRVGMDISNLEYMVRKTETIIEGDNLYRDKVRELEAANQEITNTLNELLIDHLRPLHNRVESMGSTIGNLIDEGKSLKEIVKKIL